MERLGIDAGQAFAYLRRVSERESQVDHDLPRDRQLATAPAMITW
jgi:hypothetical protein